MEVNNKAMREALIKIRDLTEPCEGVTEVELIINDIAKAALDAPPRNCDRFATLPDALAAWRDIDPREAGPFDLWLFAPATAKEGGAK